MAKTKTLYECTDCGSTFPKWQGHCDTCASWNSLVEKTVEKAHKLYSLKSKKTEAPIAIKNVSVESHITLKTGINECDTVLGKGIVKGSVTLLGGEPGIGKSTLSLQICQNIAANGLKVLYVTAEEGVSQIRARADRIGTLNDNLYVYSESSMQSIIDQCDALQPDLILIDSIQVVYHHDVTGIEGSVSQVRHCANVFLQWIKANQKAGMLIGHITKDGQLAGPKVLEHVVDVILYLEGDRQQTYRLLRCHKNRFSTTQAIGLFEMKEAGMIEIQQPSEFFIESLSLTHPGSIITPILEGNRVLLVELQALVVKSGYGMSKRTFVGVNSHRATLIVAAIDKYFHCKIAEHDVFLNIIGGLKVAEPALDLGIIVAILSSLLNVPLTKKVALVGEVALTGELRSVPQMKLRCIECMKMGFESIVIPEKSRHKELNDIDIKIIYAKDIKEVIADLFEGAIPKKQ